MVVQKSAQLQFGTESHGSNTCDIQTIIDELISPGENATFSVEASSIIIESNGSFCHYITHCGNGK